VAEPVILESPGARLALDPACGHLARLAFGTGDAAVEPLYRAPWADRADALDPVLPPVLRHLSGDFFCAPFGACDVEEGPAHGPAANAPWRLLSKRESGEDRCLELDCARTILGARIEKTLRLRGDDPVLYQDHRLVGGEGAVPVAHHAMVRAAGGCRLSTSPKRRVATPPEPLEPDPAVGTSILAYPQSVPGLDSLALADGSTVDARRFPFAEGHDDLGMMVEADLGGFGWTAAACVAAGFLVFTVKPAAVLPATVLWLSNRGRTYAPFDESPGPVLGIEDACTFFHLGHRASVADNALTAEGVPTALALAPGGVRSVRFALGAVPIDARWSGEVRLTVGRGRLDIEDAGGPAVTLPFDTDWFTGKEAAGHG